MKNCQLSFFIVTEDIFVIPDPTRYIAWLASDVCTECHVFDPRWGQTFSLFHAREIKLHLAKYFLIFNPSNQAYLAEVSQFLRQLHKVAYNRGTQ